MKKKYNILFSSKLDSLHVGLEGQLANWARLVVVPQDDLCFTEGRFWITAHNCQNVTSEQHFNNADGASESYSERERERWTHSYSVTERESQKKRNMLE